MSLRPIPDTHKHRRSDIGRRLRSTPKATALTDGNYDVGCSGSWLSYKPRAIDVGDEHLQELYEYMKLVPSTYNVRFKNKVRRIQCTLMKPSDVDYDFSGQGNLTIHSNPARRSQNASLPPALVHKKWPHLVDLVLEDWIKYCAQLGCTRTIPNAVHANLYEDGDAWIDAHADNEPSIDQTVPIGGYSFYMNQVGRKRPRSLQIYPVPEKVYRAKPNDHDGFNVELEHCSRYGMHGNFQSTCTHELMKNQRSDTKRGTRVSLTVRAFLPRMPMT